MEGTIVRQLFIDRTNFYNNYAQEYYVIYEFILLLIVLFFLDILNVFKEM